MKRVSLYKLILLSSALIVLLSACGVNEPDLITLETLGVSSYTGSAAAVHMELKTPGTNNVICKVHDTPATTKPVVTSCQDGTYTEQLFDGAWKQIGSNKTVTVGGGSTPPATTGTYTGSAPAVHMQLKNASGDIMCKVYDTPATTKPVATGCPNGTWTEQLFDGAWKQIGTNKPAVVGTTTPPTSSTYTRIFTEEFDGTSLSSNWVTPSWPGTAIQRHVDVGVDFQRDQCAVSGGALKVKATLNGTRVRSCYAHSTQTFGPGSGQLNIQYRVNLSQVQAEGGWFAAWLNTLSSEGNPYDGNLATGTEIDVLEYVPFSGAYRYPEPAGGTIDTRNKFHPAVHTGSNSFEAPNTNGNGFYDANLKGINLRSGYHTFGLEWNGSCQVFSLDGQPIWKNRQGISSAQVHRLMLTMEMSNAGSNGFNNWGYRSGRFIDNLRAKPAEAQVDWVRVDRKATPDADLCN